ncbi:type 1 glutamine amidotransferase domain-containing protein [Erythrobacter sp. AP23]|uniref:type 1 glutamine amidotransferase domain-containing protein n=1 Tax=Erythrobacter sp. AP23 TaxID=499656 RepID=UPI00076D19DA|nr:type 1 glutamine amidotransferase domain-containing protein [Erythrobacter sp. AP23]KWV93923.1 hypothetical protein ASS64_13625 [Erythrobacter sp. AP23]
MIRMILLALTLLLVSPHAIAAETGQSDRILLVVSSHGRDGGESQPGYEMDELSQAWLVLRDNGFEVDIASPSGGAVVADKFDAEKAYNAAFLADPIAQSKLASTLMLETGMGDRYTGVLVIGGKGAMMDLPFSQVLQQILADTYEREGVIAAVCHGPAVLARMRTEDGSHFVAGRMLAGFTDEEESSFGKKWVPHFPFLLESELRRIGATFSEGPIMTPHVATDGRIVTGQNPFSVARTADAMIRALGQAPKAREPWADERSMELVRQFAEGDRAPLAQALAEDPAALDPMLIAAWGYYRSLEETIDRAALAQAIAVMELAFPHLQMPEFEGVIAEARRRLEGLS